MIIRWCTTVVSQHVHAAVTFSVLWVNIVKTKTEWKWIRIDYQLDNQFWLIFIHSWYLHHWRSNKCGQIQNIQLIFYEDLNCTTAWPKIGLSHKPARIGMITARQHVGIRASPKKRFLFCFMLLKQSSFCSKKYL